MKKMTPEIYEEKRNELIALLEGILKKATKIPDESRKELQDTVGKLKRNSFEIALIGEFQGGKSTVFDTLCDGRLISPRGIGIKTSASKISVQAIPQEEEEHADLVWKTSDELLLTMYKMVKDNLIGDPEELAVFSKIDKDGKEVLPSLDNSKVRELASKALQAEWKKYETAPSLYDPENLGYLDLLKISTLILEFYNSKELLELQRKKRITIDELNSIVVFPRDWEIKWEDNRSQTKWSLSQVPFVFLASASCYIHSENLERLGCVVTDCPGLFAGPWDTQVACEAMKRADAILYLMCGDRTITDSDLRALSLIRKNRQDHKVFFAVNGRSSRQNILDHLRPVNYALITQRGYKIKDERDINVFNALLAFNAKTSVLNAEEMKLWNKQVAASLATYLNLDVADDDDVGRIRDLKNDKANLYEVSDFPSLLLKIETSVVSKKFESILVKGGTEKAGRALDQLNGALIQREDSVLKKLDAINKEAKEAREKLEDFQEFVKKTIGEVLSDSRAADRLADDYFMNVFKDSIPDLGKETSQLIATWCLENQDVFLKVKELVKNRGQAQNPNMQNFPELVEPLKESFCNVIFPVATGWVTNICQGENKVFKKEYGELLRKLNESIREKWDSCFSKDTSNFLLGLEFNADIDFSNIDDSLVKIDRSVLESTFKTGMMCNIIGWIGVVVLGGFTAMLCTGPIAMVLIPVFAIATLVAYGIFKGKLTQALSTHLTPKIIEQLDESFIQRESEIKEEFKKTILTKVLDSISVRYQNALQNQLDVFNKRVEDAINLKRKGIKEQQRVAAEAKKVREEQIEPARKEIADFNNSLAPYFT